VLPCPVLFLFFLSFSFFLFWFRARGTGSYQAIRAEDCSFNGLFRSLFVRFCDDTYAFFDMYGNFDIILEPSPPPSARLSQLHPTPHAVCAVCYVHLVPMLIGG